MHTLPLHSESANYQEWEHTIGGETYTIVQDAGTWALLQQVGAEWVDVGGESFVAAFLCKYALILGTSRHTLGRHAAPHEGEHEHGDEE